MKNYRGLPYRPPAEHGWITPHPNARSPFVAKTPADYYTQSSVVYTDVPQWESGSGNYYERVVQTDACGTPGEQVAWWGPAWNQYNSTNPAPTGSVTETVVTKSACVEGYYKNVQARKVWHGTYGFLDDTSCYDNSCELPDEGGIDAWRSYHGIGTAARKYCSCAWNGTYVTSTTTYHYGWEDTGSGWQYYHYLAAQFGESKGWTRSVNVNFNSGKWTHSYTGTTASNYYFAEPPDSGSFADTTSLYEVHSDMFLFPACEGESASLPEVIAAWPDPVPVPFISGTGWSYSASYASDYSSTDPVTSEVVTYPLSDSTISISITRSNDSYVFAAAVSTGPPAGTIDSGNYSLVSITATCTVNLGGEVSSGDLHTILDTLLSEWNMTDDKIYPWRKDGYCHIAPLVCKNEKVGAANPITTQIVSTNYNDPLNDYLDRTPFSAGWEPTYGIMPCFDEEAEFWSWPSGSDSTTSLPNGFNVIYDGAIIGKPGPIGNFDVRFENWVFSACEPSPPVWWLNSYGAFNGGQNGIPLTATHWTNNHEATWTMLGAWTYDSDPYGAVWRQKWVERKVEFPSWDFNRPYGADAFVCDEPAFGCDVSGDISSGITFSCSNYLPLAGEVWGGVYTDGFYTIASVDTISSGIYTAHLGSKHSFCPTPITADFYKLRFPTASAVGLEQFTSVYDSASNRTTLAFNSELLYVSSSVNVDLYTGKQNELSVYIPDSQSASNIVLHQTGSSYYVSGNYTNSAFITGVGKNPAHYDTAPKGQIVAFTWLNDNVTNMELSRLAETLDCDGNPVASGSMNNGYASFMATQVTVPSSSVDGLSTNCVCAPACICYSNNSEDFGSESITYAIPSLVLDWRYGALWRAQVQQSINRFDFQIPHAPCATPDAVPAMDNGECSIDTETTYYYALPPQIEPFLELPAWGHGTVTDPSGSYYAWRVDSPVEGIGSNVIYPAGPSGPYNMPWIFKQNICANRAGCPQFDYTWMIC